MCVDDVRHVHGLPGGSLMKTLKYIPLQICVKRKEKTPIVNLHQKKTTITGSQSERKRKNDISTQPPFFIFSFLLLPSPFYFKFRTDLDPCSRRFRHRVEQSIIIVLMSRSELSPSLSKFMNLWSISTQHPTSLITTRGYWREARGKLSPSQDPPTPSHFLQLQYLNISN